MCKAAVEVERNMFGQWASHPEVDPLSLFETYMKEIDKIVRRTVFHRNEGPFTISITSLYPCFHKEIQLV